MSAAHRRAKAWPHALAIALASVLSAANAQEFDEIDADAAARVDHDRGRKPPVALRLDARLMLDAASVIEGSQESASATEVRRARLLADARVLEHWRIAWQYALEGDTPRALDLWASYSGLDRLQLRAGQFQEPFGLEALTVSTALTLMERSQANLFAPGYSPGVAAATYGRGWSGQFGVFFAGDLAQGDVSTQELAVTGRATLAPLGRRGRVLHLGAAASVRKRDSDERLRFRPDDESHLFDLDLVRTPVLRDVDGTTSLGLEAGFAAGGWLVQGEYSATHLDRSRNDDALLHSGYITASRVLIGTGGRYDARRGLFRRAEAGTLQAALRYSVVDLNSGELRGGRQTAVTLGLNATVSRHLRVMAEVVDTNAARKDRRAHQRVLQARVQLTWR